MYYSASPEVSGSEEAFMGSQKYSRGGAIALGVFGVALIVMLAALLVACGSGTHSSPLQSTLIPDRIDYELALSLGG